MVFSTNLFYEKGLDLGLCPFYVGLITFLGSHIPSVEVSPMPKWTLGYSWTAPGGSLPGWMCPTVVVASLGHPAGGLQGWVMAHRWVFVIGLGFGRHTERCGPLFRPSCSYYNDSLLFKQWTLFLTVFDGKSATTSHPRLGSQSFVLQKGLLGQGMMPQHAG